MSLAVACSSWEGRGAVVVVDSARRVVHSDGRDEVEVVDDKMFLLGERAAAVYLGPARASYDVVRMNEDGGNFEVAADQVFRHLAAAEVPTWAPYEWRESCLLMAGVGRPGEPVRLTYRRSTHRPVYAPLLQGALFVAGESEAWKGGEDVLECADKAVTVATRLMRSRIDRARRLDRVASVAWPLRMATVTPWGVETEDVTEAEALTWCARLEGGASWEAVVGVQEV